MSAPKTKPKAAKPKASENGEAAAAKAEVAKLAAKAAEAQAKAEADAKLAAAASAKLTELLPTLTEADAAWTKAEADEYAAAHAFGSTLLVADGIIAGCPALGTTISAWATAAFPLRSGPSWGSSPAYRSLQAARVAAKAHGIADRMSIDSLTPAHKLVSLEKGSTKAIRDVLTAAAKAAAKEGIDTPQRRHVEAAIAAKYPTKASGGSRGTKKGTKAAAGNGKTKAAAKPAGVTELPDHAVSDSTLGAAKTLIDGIFNAANTDEQRSAVYRVASQVMESVRKYGIAATLAAVESHKPTKTKKAAKAQPKTK